MKLMTRDKFVGEIDDDGAQSAMVTEALPEIVF